MPLLVKLDNKRRWDRPGWLVKGEIPAEALQDFNVDHSNELSVWYIDPANSNVDRVLTALAANREFIDKIDYTIFDEKVIDDWSIKIEKTPGKLPDDEASNAWHRDLKELTGFKLLGLATEIAINSPRRKTFAAVRDMLMEAARQGRLKKELMREALATKLPWPEGGHT